MASKEAEEFAEKFTYNVIPMKSECPNYTGEECMRTSLNRKDVAEIFDAGVESVNKRIGDVNNYYQQLDGMSEEYQKGYIQAEKDMPKQFEAMHDIIRLQKRIDELEDED